MQVTDSCLIPDESFHCQHPPHRMSIAELDPSIAVVRPAPPPWTRVLTLASWQWCGIHVAGSQSTPRRVGGVGLGVAPTRTTSPGRLGVFAFRT